MRFTFLLMLFSCFHFVLSAQTQIGSDIDGEAAGDRSGESVSLSLDGTRLAIGASSNDGEGNFAGHVRIYEESGGSWTQIGPDIDGEALGDVSGRSVSLSADGTRVAIGAPANDGNGSSTGHVRIYEESGGFWTQVGVDIDGEAANDVSGSSVSLSADGTRVAIGAPSNVGTAGHVRIYEESGGSWTQVGVDIDGEAASDLSGFSVSLSADGTRVAIGAPSNDGNGSSSGHVRIYEESGGSWTQVGVDIDGETANVTAGVSVSLSADGTRVAIGAPQNEGINTGRVRIYEESGGFWAQVGAEIDGEAVLDQSGVSVSLSADGIRVAIGALRNDGNGTDAGHIRIYEESEGLWTQLGVDIDGEAAFDQSGQSVSLSVDGTRVAIGAPLNDGNGSNAGHVRIFNISSCDDGCPLTTDVLVNGICESTGPSCDDNDPSTANIFDVENCLCDNTPFSILCENSSLELFAVDPHCSDPGNGSIQSNVNDPDNNELSFIIGDEISTPDIISDFEDFNGDGYLDYISIGPGTENRPIMIFLNDGAGNFNSSMTLSGLSYDLVDYDDDNDFDIFLGKYGDSDQLFFNDGTGLFTDSGLSIGDIENTLACDVEDIDNDGNKDIVIGVGDTGFGGSTKIKILMNDGNDQFTALSQEFNGILPYPVSVIAIFDFNNDGDNDIVYGHASSGLLTPEESIGIQTLINDGNSNFSTGQNFRSARKLAIGDLNNDGYLDFAVAGYWGNYTVLNNGDDSFSDPSYFGVGQPTPVGAIWFDANGVSLADVDLDGNLDVLFGVVAEVGNQNAKSLYLGQGDGTFIGSNLISLVESELSFRSFAKDIDRDGDIDLLYNAQLGDVKTLVNTIADDLTYSWNTTPIQTTSNLVALEAGTYTLTVTNLQGCILIDSVTLVAPQSSAASCDDGCPLTTDSFDENNCACINEAPSPDDGCPLTTDSFDESNCAIINEQPTCDDNDPNTNDSFDAANCECVNEAIVCDDGCPLTTDVLVNGICESTAPSCDDGCPLTTDSFDENNCACINEAPSPDDGCPLTTDSFDEATCTIINEQPTCDDNDPNTNDSFDATNCACINEAIICDDGCPITTDVLVNGVCESTAPSCDDGCPLTTDSFDENNCACINEAPNPDDGCPLTIDSFDEASCTIINAQPTCDDNDPCTVDSFDEANCACVNLAVPGCGVNCDDFTISATTTDVSCIGANDGSIDLTATCSGGSSGSVTNLALNKTTNQSSTNNGAISGRAVDGNTNGNWYSEYSVSSTTWTAQPWWEVDLGEVSSIEEVEIWGRTDCCQNFLGAYYILVSDNPFGNDDLATLVNRPDVVSSQQTGPAMNPSILDLNLSGRYLRIQLQGTSQLQLAEVIVNGSTEAACNLDILWDSGLGNIEDPMNLPPGIYSVIVTDQNACNETATVTIEDGTIPCTSDCSNPQNIAINKPVSQSSLAMGGVPERAVDGNTNGSFYQDYSVSHTAWENNAWWEVDLESISEIESINIWNRTDANGQFLKEYYVLVSDDPFTSTDLSAVLLQPGVSNYFESGIAGTPSSVEINRSGRFVRIQLSGTSFLALAEVEVIGCSDNSSPTCMDGVQNGDETGVDCGGNSCPPCCLPGGTICDDGDPNTSDDQEDGNCNCVGIPIGGNCMPTSNLAPMGIATQSSVQQGGVASRANDGDTNGNYYQSLSVTQTGWESNPWWEIDLGEIVQIESINIWNRTDANMQFLSEYYILVSDNPFVSSDLDNSINQPEVSNYFELNTVGTPSSQAINRSGRYVRIQLDKTAFLSIAEVEIIGCTASSVNLTSLSISSNTFDAVKSGERAQLNWATDTEYINDYFVIERSTDGEDFEEWKKINSMSSGTIATFYEEIDRNPNLGSNYYRLKQYYINGGYEYSEIKRLDFSLDYFHVFPNPASTKLFISLNDYNNESGQLHIINALGEVVLTHLMDGASASPVEIDLNEFASGFYTVILKIENQKIRTKKFVVSKL